MTLYAEDTERTYELELKSWDGCSWSPDCFMDLETNFPKLHPVRLPGTDEIVAQEAEIEDLIDWWDTEVLEANADPDYSGDGLSADGLKWDFFVTIYEA